jgi:hypothetical protein
MYHERTDSLYLFPTQTCTYEKVSAKLLELLRLQVKVSIVLPKCIFFFSMNLFRFVMVPNQGWTRRR